MRLRLRVNYYRVHPYNEHESRSETDSNNKDDNTLDPTTIDSSCRHRCLSLPQRASLVFRTQLLLKLASTSA